MDNEKSLNVKLTLLRVCGLIEAAVRILEKYQKHYRTFLMSFEASSESEYYLKRRISSLANEVDRLLQMFNSLSGFVCREEPGWHDIVKAYNVLDRYYPELVSLGKVPGGIRETMYEVYVNLKKIVENQA
jgi:hypothetical protein